MEAQRKEEEAEKEIAKAFGNNRYLFLCYV